MIRLRVLLALALVAASGCSHSLEIPSRPLPGDAVAVARFELPPEPFPWSLKPRADVPAEERAFDLTFPSAVTGESPENNTVTCRVWMPKDDAPSPRPAVVMLHYLRGTFKPMEEAGRFFAAKGFVSMLIYMPHYGPRATADPERKRHMITDDVELTVGNFRQAVLDIRRAGDWLRSRRDVDAGRVGLFGVSMGAVVGALVSGVDPRFTRTVLVAGGGDLATLVLHESKETREMRRKLLEGGWTREKLETALAPIEPLAVASRVDPANVLFINATLDQVIPKACTEKLRAAMGGPRVRWLKADHYTIALALYDILKESALHLAQSPSW